MNTPIVSRRRFLGRSAALALGTLAFGSFSLRSESSTSPAAPKYCPFRAAGIRPPDGVPDEAWWRSVRARFDLRTDRIYLNTGTTGPIPTSVREARERVEREIAEDPGADTLRLFSHEPTRKALAKAVNADADDIILTHSTTEGLNIFAFGLDLRHGDEVILGSQEHSAAINPFRELEDRIGIKIVWVDLPVPSTLSQEQIIDAYRRAITPRSRLIAASHVTYKSGLALPIKELAELAHSHGLLISVDAAQSFGSLVLDLPALGVDHYAAPGQKWLLAGTGTGFSWIRRDLQPRVRTLTGWHDPDSPRPEAHTARRYEQTGQRNVAGASGIVEALAFRQLVGPERIEARNRELASRLQHGLREIKGAGLWTPATPSLNAGLIAFTLDGLPPKAVAKTLQERSITVRTVEVDKKEALRASTHFFNSPDDVDALLASLRDFAGKPALLT